MKLYPHLAKKDTADAPSKKIDEVSETGTSKTVHRKCFEDNIMKMEKKKFVDRYEKSTLLTITASTDINEELFEICHYGSKNFIGSRHKLIPKTNINKDEVLEYIERVDGAKVIFNGHLLNIQAILEAIPDEWYLNQTVEITITDGLHLATKKVTDTWTNLLLKIMVLHRASKPKFTSLDVVTRIGTFEIVNILESKSYASFSVNCPLMNITNYEVVRELLFSERLNNLPFGNYYWELVLNIVREEADSYIETEKGVEFVIDGKQKAATFVH